MAETVQRGAERDSRNCLGMVRRKRNDGYAPFIKLGGSFHLKKILTKDYIDIKR